MTEELRRRVRYGEAFWRAHHEAWKRSELNQREYCEAERISLKAFGNWRAKFKAEPQPPQRKLLYRRGGSSHTLSHSSSHTLGHVPYPFSWSEGPVVPPPREGHRRRFGEREKRRILQEAAQPDASMSEVARRYGIARRVLCRWKQELAAPVFVAVRITDVNTPSGVVSSNMEAQP
jgi:transposase